MFVLSDAYVYSILPYYGSLTMECLIRAELPTSSRIVIDGVTSRYVTNALGQVLGEDCHKQMGVWITPSIQRHLHMHREIKYTQYTTNKPGLLPSGTGSYVPGGEGKSSRCDHRVRAIYRLHKQLVKSPYQQYRRIQLLTSNIFQLQLMKAPIQMILTISCDFY